MFALVRHTTSTAAPVTLLWYPTEEGGRSSSCFSNVVGPRIGVKQPTYFFLDMFVNGGGHPFPMSRKFVHYKCTVK